MIRSPTTTLSFTAVDKSVCETFGCTNKSTSTIEVNAGKFGIITLNICDNCKFKFN